MYRGSWFYGCMVMLEVNGDETERYMGCIVLYMGVWVYGDV